MKKEFISKYNISVSDFDFENPLTVGNGDFAFTCDVTGLQSFYNEYNTIPLCTMTNYFWAKQKGKGELPYKEYKKASNNSSVFYMTDTNVLTYNNYRDDWFKFDLFKISFYYGHRPLERKNISNISQRLSVYEGIIYSSFTYLNKKVFVETKIPQDHQNLQLKIQSELKGLQVRLFFLKPNSNRFGAEREETQDYIVKNNVVKRDNEFVSYSLYFNTNMPEHNLFFDCQRDSFLNISLDDDFNDDDSMQIYFNQAKCINCLDDELNRRMVLSLYLMKVNTLGIYPPAETGLTCNSWYGKFHLEMHLWHHLGLIRFGLYKYVLPSLNWYLTIANLSRRRANQQGYFGARLPKMTDPRGIDTPSNIGCLLIWQMPHLLIMLDEILKQDEKSVSIKDFLPLITDLIDFMASFYYMKDGKYHLDSPLIPANENIPETCDTPIFEECYTLHVFQIFKVWIDKYGISYDIGKIEDILKNYVPLEIKDDCYEAYIGCKDTYTKYNYDHPMLIGMYSFFESNIVDSKIIKNTLYKILGCWSLEDAWGWDFPMLAMAANRLGEKDVAIQILKKNVSKNTYLKNGHNPQYPKQDLPLYLPGNGAFLLAISHLFEDEK